MRKKNNEKVLKQETDFFRCLQETQLLTPEIKTALIKEIQEKSNALKTTLTNDTETHAIGERFFSPYQEQSSTFERQKNTNIKRNSGKKMAHPLVFDNIHDGYKSPTSYSSSSSGENTPKSPHTKNGSKMSPDNASKFLLNFSMKKKQYGSINKNTLIQMPIDKKTATNYVKAANKESSFGINLFKVISSPDGQYKIILVQENKKTGYYLLDNRLIGSGSNAKIVSVFNLETAELLVAKIYDKSLKHRAKCERIALEKLDRCYGFGSLNEQESVVLGKYYSGCNLLTFLYEINGSVLHHEPKYCSDKKDISGFIKLKIVYGLLEQLHVFHNNNLLHRDIKPDNIIVDITEEDEVTVTLIDLDTCVDKYAVDDEMMSTKGYIPPEILVLNKCGLMRMSFHPLFSFLKDVQKKVGEDNNALIYYDHQYFYFDKLQKEVINVTNGVTNITKKYPDREPILTFFPDEIDAYKEAESNLRRFIIQMTGRQLKSLYNEMSDVYSLGVCIAEISSTHNYQKKYREVLLKEDQAISFELTQQLMPDVFFNEKSIKIQKPQDKTTEYTIENSCDLIISDVLNKLAVKLTNTRLRDTSLINEINQLKKVEFMLKNKLHSLVTDISKGQKTLLNFMDELYPATQKSSIEREIYDQIVNNITELSKGFSARTPVYNELPAMPRNHKPLDPQTEYKFDPN